MEAPMSNFMAELVGTALLVILGNGAVANVLLNKTKGRQSGWIVITTGWGLAVATSVYCVGHISGGHINPAVTVGLAFIGAFDWANVPLYVSAQLLGAMIGATLVWLAYLGHWHETKDERTKLACFSTEAEISNPPCNLLTEAIGTFVLLFGVLGIAKNTQVIKIAHNIDMSAVFAHGINPLIVGFLVWAIGISLGGPTGYAINPARDLGPRIAHSILPIAGKGGSNWRYAWIPVLGPILGGIAGALLFKVVGL